MSTETITPPAASTPPPAAPAKAATPPIPAAQTASVKNQPANKTATTNSRTPPEAPPNLDREFNKLAEEHFRPKGEAAPAATQPVAADAKLQVKLKEAVAELTAEPAKAKETPPVAAAEKEPLDIAEPKGMTPENLANWKSWREQAKKEINDAKNEKAVLAAKLKTYETATPADTEKAARLEAQLKDVQDRLAVHDLRSHPDFVKQYVEPKKNALKEAAEIVAYNGKEGVNLSAVLDKPLKEFNAEVSAITEGMNGMDATSVQTALRQAYKLANEEKGALSKAGELKAGLEAKAAAVARQAFEEGKGEFTSRVPAMEIPAGASEERITEINAYNQARIEAIAEAEKFTFGKMSEREVAGIATRAASLNLVAHHVIPGLQRDLKRSNDLLAEATAELVAIKKSKNPGQFNEGKAKSGPDTSGMDLRQLSKHMLGGNDPR
jgi:hypothetical protein